MPAIANGAQNGRVRLAVIGAGVIGRRHAELAARLPACRLVGVADLDPAVRSLAEGLGAAFDTDYAGLIRATAPEAVIVATPTERHVSVAAACARQGLHLLVEKPIAPDAASAQALIDSARNSGVHLQVGHHRRFNPLVETARRVVRQGGLGRLVAVTVLWAVRKPDDYFQVEWRRRPGGGPVLINMIHDIDNLRYICGEIERVFAETSTAVRRQAVEDTAVATLRFAGGAVGTILASDCTPAAWSYEATAGENPYYFRTHENCYYFFGTQATLAFPRMQLTRYADPQRCGWQFPLVSETLTVEERDPLAAQLEHFCQVVRGAAAPRTDGPDALQSLRVAQAVLTSGHSGRPVAMSPEPTP